MPTDRKKGAMYKLKAGLLENISNASEEGLSTEEIIGTLETIKHQASIVMLAEDKNRRRNRWKDTDETHKTKRRPAEADRGI